jgi:hypothetical protein
MIFIRYILFLLCFEITHLWCHDIPIPVFREMLNVDHLDEYTDGGKTLPSSSKLIEVMSDNLSGQLKCSEMIDDKDGVCDIDGVDDTWKLNCLEVLDDGKVPEEAFLFALDTLKRNSKSLNTSKCVSSHFNKDLFKHYSLPNLKNKGSFDEMTSKGIRNKCSMIINNHDELIETDNGKKKCKATMYYINLCDDKPKVIKDYSYVGYGTCENKSGYKNESGKGTTLLGSFITNSKDFAFAKKNESYNRIRKRLKGRVPSLSLFGLQGSNNRSAVDYKYFHVGAGTSAGCPSIDEKNAWMIKEMAEKGPSLLLSFKKGAMEPLDKCE